MLDCYSVLRSSLKDHLYWIFEENMLDINVIQV